jgi:hypothetical protein
VAADSTAALSLFLIGIVIVFVQILCEIESRCPYLSYESSSHGPTEWYYNWQWLHNHYIATYNKSDGQSSNLEVALRACEKMRIDVGILMETRLSADRVYGICKNQTNMASHLFSLTLYIFIFIFIFKSNHNRNMDGMLSAGFSSWRANNIIIHLQSVWLLCRSTYYLPLGQWRG